MKMDNEEINRLFLQTAGAVAQRHHPEVKKIFSLLISSTLQYRDYLKLEKGITLTVEDVQTALDWLIQIFTTKKLPQTDEGVRLGLLKIWLDELQGQG